MSPAAAHDLARRPTTRAEAERFCPECGQSLAAWRLAPSSRTTAAWWPGLLAVVGLSLMLAFGARAWTAHRTADNSEGPRHLAAGRTASASGDQATWTLNPRVDLARLDQRVRDLTTDRLARRDLAVAAIGVLALLMGTGSMMRQSLLQGSHRQDEKATGGWRGPFRELVLGIWTLAETLVSSVFRLLLLAFVYIGAAQALQGEQLSEELVAPAIERTVGALLSALQAL